jgi:hypothetical protein
MQVKITTILQSRALASCIKNHYEQTNSDLLFAMILSSTVIRFKE